MSVKSGLDQYDKFAHTCEETYKLRIEMYRGHLAKVTDAHSDEVLWDKKNGIKIKPPQSEDDESKKKKSRIGQ